MSTSLDLPAPATTEHTVGVVGTGVVGSRVQRRLGQIRDDAHVVPIDVHRTELEVAESVEGLDVVVLAMPAPHVDTARALLGRGVSVVSISDRVSDVVRLIELGPWAESNGVSLVVGAGMSDGLAALLARHLASGFERVDEIHVAVHGTAGPACARQHHRALAGTSTVFHDGVERTRRAGTGRELVFFPEPVRPYDCYLAELPTTLHLHRAFPEASRLTARMSANRRDRLTSRLPMLTPPHAEGGVGALRVELRGAAADGSRLAVVAGIAELVGTAAAATALSYADLVISGGTSPGVVLPGDPDHDTRALLINVGRLGVRLQEFTGVPRG